MFLIFYKIDWDCFVREFPSGHDTWTRKLETDFEVLEPNFAAEWAEFARDLANEFPEPMRGPFNVVADVAFPEHDGVKLPHKLTKKDRQRVRHPYFDPRGMQEIFAALDALGDCDLHQLVTDAWPAAVESGSCELYYFEDVEEYLAFMDTLLGILKEIQRDNCVLGYHFA